MSREIIDGIHMYCDRWCERCAFTARCAVYESEKASGPPDAESDASSNAAFWERVESNLAKAQEFLLNAAREAGVDMSLTSAESEAAHALREQVRADSRKHPLATLSLEYSRAGRAWLKSQPGMLERLESLKRDLTLGLESDASVRHQTETIRDSLAVIQWYLSFIHIKLTRALFEKVSRRDDDNHLSFNGTAKVAIVGTDRSLGAWSALFQILPDQEDHFLEILSMLQKIRTMATEEFPDALSFVRPGLDD